MYLHYLIIDKNQSELEYDEYFKHNSGYSRENMDIIKNKYYKS